MFQTGCRNLHIGCVPRTSNSTRGAKGAIGAGGGEGRARACTTNRTRSLYAEEVRDRGCRNAPDMCGAWRS